MVCFYCKHPLWTPIDLFCIKCGKKQPRVCEGTEDEPHEVPRVLEEEWRSCPFCKASANQKGGLAKLTYACPNIECEYRYDRTDQKFCVRCGSSLAKKLTSTPKRPRHSEGPKSNRPLTQDKVAKTGPPDDVADDVAHDQVTKPMAGGVSPSHGPPASVNPNDNETKPRDAPNDPVQGTPIPGHSPKKSNQAPKTVDDVSMPTKRTTPRRLETKTVDDNSSVEKAGSATSLPNQEGVRDLSPQRNVAGDRQKGNHSSKRFEILHPVQPPNQCHQKTSLKDRTMEGPLLAGSWTKPARSSETAVRLGSVKLTMTEMPKKKVA